MRINSLRRIASLFPVLAAMLLQTSLLAPAAHSQQDNDDSKATSLENTSITSLPTLERSIHDAMQSRSFGDAAKLIEEKLATGDAGDPDYLRYLQGIAYSEDDKLDLTMDAFDQLERDFPESIWISRSRFGRADVFVRRRQYIDAGKIYKQEAERLLSRGRKDRLADIYLEYANRYFQGTPAKDPSKQRQPDFKQALTYYSEAAKLGTSPKLKQHIEFRIARCQEELEDYDQASHAYEQFLERYASGEHKATAARNAEARYRLGDVLLKAGRPTEARRVWQDFLSDNAVQSEIDEATQEFLARAQYRFAHTYGLPSPKTLGDLELAVTAVERFLKRFPQHELAPVAELEVAQGYASHARHREAVSRLKSLISNDQFADSKQVPVAREMLGRELLAQNQFDAAIKAWKEFLEEHPSDPNWPVVQEQIVAAEYAKALHARNREQYVEARSLWETFLNKYPLDSRAPAILLQFGSMKSVAADQSHQRRVRLASRRGESPQGVAYSDEEKTLYREAIDDWRRVVAKYPGTDAASEAAFRIGLTLEDRLGQLKEALDSYRNVAGRYAGKAQPRIARLTSPQLSVSTERKFRSDEKPRIKLTARNLETVQVKVYRVDMVDYFRKMHLASGIETLDIALIDPDEQFQHQIEEYEQYKQFDVDIPLPAWGRGVTAVTVASEKQESTTMVVVSDLDMVVKASRNELFLFAEDMLEQAPAEGVSVLISDGDKVFAESITNAEGIVQQPFEELKSIKDLRVFAVREGHVCSTVNSLKRLKFSVGLSPKGYLYTDRPAYRTGQAVNFRGIVRWVEDDRHVFREGELFQLDVLDPRGRQLFSREVSLDRFGSVAGQMVLPRSAPQGEYRVQLHRTATGENDEIGNLTFNSTFRVAEYKLEPIRLSIDTEKEVYYRGESVTGTMQLQYYYGLPLADETIEYQLGPESETFTATTDAEGKFKFRLDTQRFSETQSLALSVRYPLRDVQQSKTVFLATHGFAITASSMREVYLSDEPFEALFRVSDAAGTPVATELKVEVYELLAPNTRVSTPQKLIAEHSITTDPDAGEGRQSIKIGTGGRFAIRAIGTDQFGNKISGQVVVRVSGDEDSTRLRILADRHSYSTGESASVNLHWREAPALALITMEGAGVLTHRLHQLQEGDNPIEVPIVGDFAPNVFLSVAVMQRNEFHEAESQFRVSAPLQVVINPVQKELRPGDDLTVEIKTTDANDRPVRAALSLAVIQSNLINSYSDTQSAISSYFSQGLRRRSVRQSTSCTFSYRPSTKDVSRFLLAEADRRETLERELRALAEFDDSVGSGFDNIDFDVDDDMAFGALNDDAITTLESDFAVDLYANSSGSIRLPNQTEVLLGGAAAIAGDRIVRDTVQGIAGRVNRRDMRHRFGSGPVSGLGNLPTLQYRTEVRNGRQIQVPYVSNDQMAASLGSSQQRATVFYHQSRLKQRVADGGVWMDSTFSAESSPSLSVNGFASGGQMQTVNAADASKLIAIAEEQGLQLIPSSMGSETAFWDPQIVTDEQGEASLTLTMPDRSTAWTLSAKGIDRGTLAGDGSAEVITRKELFAELRLPRAFTVGDHAEIPVEIHSSHENARNVSVRLNTRIADKTVEERREVSIKGPGVTTTVFEIDIEDGDQADFNVAILDDERPADQTSMSVKIRPYGYPVFETTGGTASQSTFATIAFPDGTNANDALLTITVGPDMNRWLVEAILGRRSALFDRCVGPASTPTERSTSDILGGVGVSNMIAQSRNGITPEATAIQARISAAVTQLVSAQNDQGGWSWNSSADDSSADNLLTSRVMWALSAAQSTGIPVPQTTIDAGKAYLKSAFAAVPQADLEQQAVLLHAMAVCECGDFAYANRLYRERNRLSPAALAYLVLSMNALAHPEMASDLTELIEIASDAKIRTRSGLTTSGPWMRDESELQAIWMLAFQSARPRDPAVRVLAQSLPKSRIGSRWPIEKSNGPAIAALARWHSESEQASEKYDLGVFVNGREVAALTIDPRIDGTREIDVASEVILDNQPQKIELRLDGRATFGFSAVLSGFVSAEEIESSTKSWSVTRRYEPSRLQRDGKDIPSGFDVVQGSYSSFTNPMTQLAVGEQAEVTLMPRRPSGSRVDRPQQDYLVLIDPLPAGTNVLEGSVRGNFDRFEVEPGRITFYLGTNRNPGNIRYTLVGYVAGQFRAPPSMLRSFYEPSLFSVAASKTLRILPAGQQSQDAYRLTPDELYHLGAHEYAKGNHPACHQHLTELYGNWQLDADKRKNTVRWLFLSSLAMGNHADTVKYFEVLKEKFPDVELSFDDILMVADAYREIGEYERGYLVYRATIEGSFERESQVAGFLNARGEFARSVLALESLTRDYPAESYVATATYALAQETYRRAEAASADARLQEQGLTRVHLIDAAINMLDHFVTTWPNDPANDEASFALATALIDLEQYEAAIERSEQYASRYPNSRLLDSFWYMIGYSHFELEHPEQALEMCRRVAEATFPIQATGRKRPADNRWEAIYIMGQIYHSLGKAANAIAEYTRVSDRFADAAEAISYFNRKSIELEEVTTIEPGEQTDVALRFRNIATASIKAYRIDLMKFGLMQRNLDRITAINLAGIRPYHEASIELGEGKDYRDRLHDIDLPLNDEGAYLIVCRGGDLYASGLVLVSPLKLQVQEDATSGRVRVSIKDLTDDAFVRNVHVKVIGSANDEFVSGDTDLRGLFIADDIRGTSTVIAAIDGDRYAFFRGETPLQGATLNPPSDSPFGEAAPGQQQAMQQQESANAGVQNKNSLRNNLFQQNRVFQEEQQGNYEDLLNNSRSGIKSKEAF